jgi:hypothetical protein
MWRRFWKPLVIVLPTAAIVFAVLYIIYRVVDPLPPRHLAIAAGMAGSGYDNFARQYARILARDGVELEVRNSAGAVEDLDLLRDPASRVQAALTCVCRKPRPFDRVTESPNVGRDDRADILPVEPGCLALQAQEPT